MKKLHLSLAAILFAFFLFSCNKEDSLTNTSSDEGTLANPKGGTITANANPAIVWRMDELLNRKSCSSFWVMDANGANQTRLYNPNITSGKNKKIYLFQGPHWSPDGGSICFTQDWSLYKLNVTLVNGVPTATNVTKLLDATANNSTYYDSYWSFGTTNEIIFTVLNKSDNLYRIQAISGNGVTPTTIYTGAVGVQIRYVTVSPDGNQIAFTSKEGTNRYLKVINRSVAQLPTRYKQIQFSED